MSKRIFALVIMIMMLFAMGCDGGQNNVAGGNGDASGGDSSNGGGTDNGGSVEERNADGEFFYRGIVKSVDARKYIEIEIIDSQVAFGIYQALVDSGTLFFNAEGDVIDRADIKVGDTVEVIFSGQVMLSFPPQIYAQKIILK